MNDHIDSKSIAVSGFTLIEIIVSITVSAILAVILVQYFGSHTGRSYLALEYLNRELTLRGAMDQITSDYRNLLLTSPQPLVTLQNNISNGDYWTGNEIQVTENYCLDFVPVTSGQWTESKTADACTHPSDTILKVVLSMGNQSLTGLFSR